MNLIFIVICEAWSIFSIYNKIKRPKKINNIEKNVNDQKINE